MKMMRINYLLFALLGIPLSCNSAQPGLNDPPEDLADSLVIEDREGSEGAMQVLAPEWSMELDAELRETSGLILWGGFLWTMNDDTDTRLYQVDPGSAELKGSILLQGVVNQDWEEISQDGDYIYLGDFGNNGGNRRNLHILRIGKEGLKSGKPAIDTIWFTYSDQVDFVSRGFNQTEFDCEAFVIGPDSIYLFTKQWLSGHTTQYVLPKVPGNFVARKRDSCHIEGQVSGATFLEEEGLLVLCGYSGLMQPFMHLFYNYRGDDFFSGDQKRVNIALPFHQVEAIASEDGTRFYISNEQTTVESYINIPQKLHLIDLSALMESL